MKRAIIVLLALGLLLGTAQTVLADACNFVLGFATVRSMIPTVVGACIENEWHNGCNGDGIQRTTGGMMVWRKADNWTAFTDGYRTWINGPCGLQQRLNSQRFPWEPEIGGAIMCSAAPVPLPAGYVQPPLCGEAPGPAPGPAPAPAPGAPTIAYFNAAPSTISAGSSTTLSWDLSGATSADIDQGIGGVTAPGTRSVSPGSTTTYTLTAHGAGGNTTATVTVNVTGAPLPPPVSVVYDFIDRAGSTGSWQSGAGNLPFPGGSGDSGGFARWVDGAALNNGTTAPRVLETHPQWIDNGFISKCYFEFGSMGYTVQSSDRITGKIGFLNGAGAGNVNFIIIMRALSPSVNYNVLSMNRTYASGMTTINVPLAAYAGRGADFCLKVDANGSSGQDWAVWQDLRLIRGGS